MPREVLRASPSTVMDSGYYRACCEKLRARVADRKVTTPGVWGQSAGSYLDSAGSPVPAQHWTCSRAFPPRTFVKAGEPQLAQPWTRKMSVTLSQFFAAPGIVRGLLEKELEDRLQPSSLSFENEIQRISE